MFVVEVAVDSFRRKRFFDALFGSNSVFTIGFCDDGSAE